MTTDRTSLARNATAAAAAVLPGLAWRAALHIAGDQYGVGLAAIGLAALLDRAAGLWLTRVLLWAAVLGTLIDAAADAGALGWTMGVAW